MDLEKDDIDPEWWTSAFDATDLDEFEAPERLSVEFDRMRKEPRMGDFQREVLEVLAAATSAMLKPGDWLEPYQPAMELADGRRSILPSDLSTERIALLARIAPLVEQQALKARVADVAWTYGDRSNLAMIDMATDAYRAAPLTDAIWFSTGKNAWQRAFDLANRLGTSGAARIAEMTEALRAEILAGTAEDGFRVPGCAQLLHENSRVDVATAAAIAEHLISLAATEGIAPRLSRHLEREAAAWSRSSEDDPHACVDRIARTYIAEADARIATDPKGGALVEGHFLEKAIAQFRTLPRSYRVDHGIEELISELRERLSDTRQNALEAMMRIESDPVDLTDAVAQARTRVSGRASAWEALIMFATLMPPLDADSTRKSAQEIVTGSISHIFSSATYSGDGRKVAATPGITGEGDDPAVWVEMVRTVAFHAQLVSTGLIIPSQQVLTFEHRFDRDMITKICADSPVVPEGHAELWGAGLTFGLSGDYGPAVAILVPQVEQLVRVLLKRRGTHTLFVDEHTGVESEKSLGALLDMPEAENALGAGMVVELKALLLVQGAANLRNDIAHGLFDDAAARTHTSAYVWWFCLRLVVWPLMSMQAEGDAPVPSAAEQEPSASDPDSAAEESGESADGIPAERRGDRENAEDGGELRGD